MLENIDKAIFYSINHGLSNSLFNSIMPIISAIGDGPLLFVISFIFLFSKKREIKILGLVLLAGLTISYYAVSALKVLIARPRPFLVLPDAFVFVREKGMSFPSNHAAAAFMAATTLRAYFKRYTAVFYLLASAIAIARIYMGVHYSSDVAAGSLLGIVIGFFLIDTAKRLTRIKIVID